MRGLPQVPFDSAEAVRLCAGSTMSCRWRRQTGQSCQAKTALADTGNSAHPADREAGLLRPDEAEGHPRRALPDRWRSPATSLSREEGAAFLKMSLFAGKMPPRSLSDPERLLQDRILTPQPLPLGIDIDRCPARLTDITLAAPPAHQRR